MDGGLKADGPGLDRLVDTHSSSQLAILVLV